VGRNVDWVTTTIAFTLRQPSRGRAQRRRRDDGRGQAQTCPFARTVPPEQLITSTFSGTSAAVLVDAQWMLSSGKR
jgi:hypothetical protein